MIRRIVAGGQTGVDRAALDAALESSIPIGGWCPLGRRAEDQTIPLIYPLIETPSPDYRQRTEWNVRDSDATLIIASEPLTGGTLLTTHYARVHGKPLMVVDPRRSCSTQLFLQWLSEHGIKVLNVAGPRESGQPGIYQEAKNCLKLIFKTAIVDK